MRDVVACERIHLVNKILNKDRCRFLPGSEDLIRLLLPIRWLRFRGGVNKSADVRFEFRQVFVAHVHHVAGVVILKVNILA